MPALRLEMRPLRALLRDPHTTSYIYTYMLFMDVYAVTEKTQKNSYVGISAAFNCFWHDIHVAIEGCFQYLIILRIRAVRLAPNFLGCCCCFYICFCSCCFSYKECVLAQ